jgi:Na+-translocating ferredoxin:NAD+ oxidoreductase subunit B
MKDVYQRLAEFLDTFPQRYPLNTQTGIELRILKRIFTPEEAEMTMKLKATPESATEIAERIGTDPEATEKELYDMSKNGLIYRTGKPGSYKYMATAFLIGLIELQANRMTPELAKDMKEFEPYLFEDSWMKGNTRALRTIPVAESVDSGVQVMPYESAEEAIRSSRHIAVSECFCRKMSGLLNEPCDRPLEVCFLFGSGTHYFVENGLARYISQEEALAILKQGIDAALVCQMTSPQKPASMCMCCDCCCVSLRTYKKQAKPSEWVNSNFFARVSEDACTGCELCVDRCPMDAVSIDDTAYVDPDRCIGCGLCAVACPTEAIKVYRKDKEKEFVPEVDLSGTDRVIYRQRREG